VSDHTPAISILGCRGIPAGHGGFESFAERLSLFLIQSGWRVTVYCQANQQSGSTESEWRGVRLVSIGVRQTGALGTIVFDLLSTLHAAREGRPVLTLGYNTSPLFLVYRLRGITNIVNMDGLEWKRSKWSWWQRAWLRVCERVALRLANRCVADHPAIARHLCKAGVGTEPGAVAESMNRSAKGMAVIPYGCGPAANDRPEALEELGLQANDYAIAVARLEPENSMLEIVSGWSLRARGHKLIVVGDIASVAPRWADQLRSAASDEVFFAGALYDADRLATLRRGALVYLHGHRVGGTNPSLLEAMAAGNAVVAHDNDFNRQVAADGALYFNDTAGCDRAVTALLADGETRVAMGQANSRAAHSRFSDQACFEAWRELLLQAQAADPANKRPA